MGKSLNDYAAAHPLAENLAPEIVTTAEKSAAEYQEEQKKAEQLKKRILAQLEQGMEPEIILYTAFECIGLYSSDLEFANVGKGHLSRVYADLAQRSFIVDNAEIAAARLSDQQAEYNKRLRNGIARQLAGYKKIAQALGGVLDELDRLEDRTNSEN